MARLSLGDKQRADRLAGQRFGQDAGLAAAGDDHVFAGRSGDARSRKLAGHASFAQAGGLVANQRQDRSIEPGDGRESASRRILRIAIEQAVDIGEQHQQRRQTGW